MNEETWEQIHVVGVDDFGPATLADTERALVGNANLLCGGRRALALFPSGTAERLTIGSDLEAVYARLRDAPGQLRAVVLASGDPCFFGIGPLLAERLGRQHVQIHPRASSVALAFARLGMAWQDATVLSVHGRPIADVIPAALSATKLAFLTDPEHTPALVASALLGAGLEDCPTYVFERLGGPAEAMHAVPLAEVPGRCFDPLNVFVVLPPARSACSRAFGRPDSDYRSVRGQITKAEVRAITIARLEPWRSASAWDIGAGSGSVAIEMAALMPGRYVEAVERDPEQIASLQENARVHNARRVRVHAGAAPASLDLLPAPDAVFVGGGGRDLEAILRVCAERLLPGGRLVANLARLESLTIWQAVAADLGWPRDVAQIAVARGTPIGEGTRLAALNPVFVTRLSRPEARQ
jgi:precorrin-6Y C5,15-methyltransferase (decarboxylating)